MDLIAGGGVTAARGFVAGAARAGIKTQGPDLALVLSECRCTAAATYTSNKVKAASLLLSQEHLRDGCAQAVVVNSGNANACTGDAGLQDALEMARAVADVTGIAVRDVVVASTGVVGVRLPVDRVRACMPNVVLSREGGHLAAEAIMTTDIFPKECAVRVGVGKQVLTIGGMAKGSGMIHPNMATMLAFLTTDAVASAATLQQMLRAVVADTFNMITVDGDTSVSDMVVLLANGSAGNRPLEDWPEGRRALASGLRHVAGELAKAIARDGEGASKLIEVTVRGAASKRDAKLAARAVAGSQLFKAAVYGADPNWGRIMTAVGYSGAAVDQDKADVEVGGVSLLRQGHIQAFDRDAGSSAMRGSEVAVLVDLHLGIGKAIAWGCDLTERYVAINAHYTT